MLTRCFLERFGFYFCSYFGHCLIIDGHSFCNDAFGYLDLPDFCIGSDSFHTDNELIGRVQEFLQGYGYSVAVNYPYSGAIVPLKHYHENPRVKSIMIEVNKRLYLEDGTMNKNADFDKIKQVCSLLIEKIRL